MSNKTQFDEIRHIGTTNYGIVRGNNTVLLTKAGQDGSYIGYQNKYLTIARRINEKYGCTVVCVSNPFDGKTNPLNQDMAVVSDVCPDFENAGIYYMGHSNGAVIGARWGYLYPQIKKMLLTNPPIYMNWSKFESGISKFNGEVTFCFTRFDPSIPHMGLLDKLENTQMKTIILPKGGHNFEDALAEYIALPERCLFHQPTVIERDKKLHQVLNENRIHTM